MKPGGSAACRSGNQAEGARRVVLERGLSPVVGAAILIGIVVVLASVIGAFVLSFGPGGETAPDASFEFSEQRVDVFTDNGSNRWTGVLALEITHRSGDQVDRDLLDIKHTPDIGGTVSGYALGARDSDNVTAPRWNRIDRGSDVAIEGGDTTRYFLYMTERIGSDGAFGATNVSNAWERDRCTIERFGEPRETSAAPEGVLNVSSGGEATDGCPAPPGGYNVTSTETDQAGRIRPGDTTTLVWESPQGSSTTLGEHEVQPLG